MIKIFSILSALLGALLVLAFFQRAEIINLRLILWQMTGNPGETELQEIFGE